LLIAKFENSGTVAVGYRLLLYNYVRTDYVYKYFAIRCEVHNICSQRLNYNLRLIFVVFVLTFVEQKDSGETFTLVNEVVSTFIKLLIAFTDLLHGNSV